MKTSYLFYWELFIYFFWELNINIINKIKKFSMELINQFDFWKAQLYIWEYREFTTYRILNANITERKINGDRLSIASFVFLSDECDDEMCGFRPRPSYSYPLVFWSSDFLSCQIQIHHRAVLKEKGNSRVIRAVRNSRNEWWIWMGKESEKSIAMLLVIYHFTNKLIILSIYIGVFFTISEFLFK